jgi:hypothetical protein
MNRTQRALKKQMRELEDGRASFKKIYLEGAKGFGTTVNTAEVKKLQAEQKKYRKQAREYSQKIAKEAAEA